MTGNDLGSTALEFVPQRPAQAGNYAFDVNDAREGGGADAAPLVVQAVPRPLAFSVGEGRLLVRGGTHVL